MAKETLSIGKSTNIRIMPYKDILNGGYAIMLVWLNRNYEHDEHFELADIGKTQTLLHFCDKGSVSKMIEILQDIEKEWQE